MLPMPADVDSATLQLYFPQLDRRVVARAGETVLQTARRLGVRIVGACGGQGSCGSCVVHLLEGEVERLAPAHEAGASAAADSEAGACAEAFVGKQWVRACQVRPRGACSIEVAPRSLALVARCEMDTGADDERLPLDAAVTSVDLDLPAPSLADNLADAERLYRALQLPDAAIDLAAARQLPARLRQHGGALRVRLRGAEIIDLAAPGQATLGLAVDLGTTNAAAFLVDLQSGVRLASLGIENPQAQWGADLISRINHAVSDAASAEALRQAALAAINALAHDLCHAMGAAPGDIVDVALCGNTAMHHLLLGLPVRQLGRAPFVAALRHAVDAKARDLGIAVSPGAYVHIAANIGGFVGGDHVAALLATEAQWRAAGTSLVMDIGTNTEISLIHQGVVRSVSSPSGPALEGGNISCGMRAAQGAIERVTLTPAGRLEVHTIGGGDPVGLCGSGVLDALATLYRGGLVDARGRIASAHADIVPLGNKRAVRLAAGVLFTQDDVRAVQLAKAAIRTAVELLLEEAGLLSSDLACCIIAGAFGAYIDVASAIAIGMLPELPRQRYHQVGNAAGVGVRMLLTSRQARTRAAALAGSCHYLELSTRKDFQKSFIKHIAFPGLQHAPISRTSP